MLENYAVILMVRSKMTRAIEAVITKPSNTYHRSLK